MRKSRLACLVSVLIVLPPIALGNEVELRRMLEEQQALIESQGVLIRELSQRLERLEGNAGGVPDSTPEERGFALAEQDVNRSAPNDVTEITLDQTRRELKTGKEAQIVDEAIVLTNTLDLYGSLRVFGEVGSGNASLNDGSSRLGFRYNRELAAGPSLFGRAEWRVNLVDSDSEFIADRDSSGGSIIRPAEDQSSALTTRLGYLGARIDGIGEFTMGKQWSVYYDVAGWTDNFNVYGGAGLSVFPSGSDGGANGSGRADNALVFRGEYERIKYGVQTQLRDSIDGADYESLGASFIGSPAEHWDVGLAFNASRVEGVFEELTGGDESHTVVLGARYRQGPWYAALAVASWKNHEAIFLENDTIIYDGLGSELFVSYEYSPDLHIYGGFNYADPDVDDNRVDDDFGRRFGIFGVSYFATPESFAYLEMVLSDSVNEDGEDLDSVLSLGYRFDY